MRSFFIKRNLVSEIHNSYAFEDEWILRVSSKRFPCECSGFCLRRSSHTINHPPEIFNIRFHGQISPPASLETQRTDEMILFVVLVGLVLFSEFVDEIYRWRAFTRPHFLIMVYSCESFYIWQIFGRRAARFFIAATRPPQKPNPTSCADISLDTQWPSFYIQPIL